MMRVIVVFLIGVGCLILSGCVPIRADSSLHPHSAVITPTFCLYEGNDPKPIVSIIVERRSKDDDQRIEIMEWRRKLPWAASDQNAWILEYAPDPSDPYQKPFTCITYGKAPPGYKQAAPAMSLIPERLYTVSFANRTRGNSKRWARTLFFIIRADPTGRPVKVEYGIDPISTGIRVINQE